MKLTGAAMEIMTELMVQCCGMWCRLAGSYICTVWYSWEVAGREISGA